MGNSLQYSHTKGRADSAALAGLILLLLTLCANGCGGGAKSAALPEDTRSAQPASNAAPRLDLPAPLTLARTASFTDADRLALGAAYNPMLPHNLSSINGQAAAFDPAYAPPASSGMGNLAYATYVFSLAGFAGTELLARWSTAPVAGNLWFGLADFSANRWVWLPGQPDAVLSVGDFTDYVNPGSGTVFVVVLLTGTKHCELTWLRLGGNVPPLAQLGADVTEGNYPLTVNFNTLGSQDPDGSIVSYDWDLDGDGTYEEINTPDNAKQEIFNDPGTTDVHVHINDNSGGSGIATLSINVLDPGRLPPTAVLAASTQAGVAPLAVSFGASGSTAPGGTIVKFEWDWEGDGTYDLDTGTVPSAAHTYNAVGIYQATLRVTDDIDVKDTDTKTITVSATNTPPTAAFTADSYFGDAPLDVNLDASASTDSDGTIADYAWDWDNDGTFDENFASPTCLHSFGTGVHTVKLRVTDNEGATSEVTTTITGDTPGYDEVENNEPYDVANQLPMLAFSGWEGNLGEGGYDGDQEDWYKFDVLVPSSVELKMDFLHADADLDMKLYAADGSTELGSSTSTGNGEAITKYLEPGNYVWKCYRYSSSTGLVADYILSATFTIVQQPVAVISAVPTSGAPPLTVDFDGTASYDPGGGALTKYEWDLDGSGSYESSGAALSTIQGIYYRPGTYTATLRVTNAGGATDTDSIQITVSSHAYDEVENNDDTAQANVFPAFPFAGFFADLGHDGYDGDDADWYGFTLGAPGTADLTMTFYDPFGDLDMKLYSSDGTTEVGSSTGVDNDENINVHLDAGTYYIKCYTFSPSSGNYGGYTLTGAFTPD